MDFIEYLIRALGYSIRHTKRSIANSPTILLVPLLGSLVYGVLSNLLLSRSGGIFTGFINGLIYSAVLSYILVSYYQVMTFKRYRIQEFDFQLATSFIWDVYGILFVLMLVNLVVGLVPRFYSVLMIVLSVVFNPIGEQIYIGRKHYVQNIRDVWEYMKRNWMIWIPINGLLIFLLHMLGKNVFDVYYLPQFLRIQMGVTFRISMPIMQTVKWAIFQVIIAVYIMFRGHLYDFTRLSSIRKREFMNYFD